MNLTRRQLLATSVASAAFSTTHLCAQSYPSKTIQFVVPFAAGGGNDVLARMIAPRLAEKLGQPVIVDNKPGAGGNIGSQLVARSAPDGHTLLLATNTLTLNPFLLSQIPFDVTKDFSPIATIANQPIVVVVNPDVQANNIKELVALMKANPGKLSYATPGNGTPHHFTTEMFKQMAGVHMVHIPYKGASPALTDLIAGQVQVMFASVISALPFIKSGRLKVLATAEGHRLSVLKDVPTIKESGYPSFEATIWGGIIAAAKTPAAITERLSDIVLRSVSVPEFASQLQHAGFEIAASGPSELAARIRTDLKQWGQVAKSIGIIPE